MAKILVVAGVSTMDPFYGSVATGDSTYIHSIYPVKRMAAYFVGSILSTGSGILYYAMCELVHTTRDHCLSFQVQGICQFIWCAIGLSHYFCFLNFFQEIPVLIFIRILYFANPQCASTINIGTAISSMPNQALVLFGNRTPDPTYRTFMVNAVYFGLSILMIITGSVMLSGGARRSKSVHVRWPWIIVTLTSIIGDVSIGSLFIGDIFNTRTLQDLVDYIGATLSGAGATPVNTEAASIAMTVVYGRFGILIVLNIYFMIAIVFECGRVLAKKKNNEMLAQIIKATDKESASSSSSESEVARSPKIPRVTVFRRLPNWLMKERARNVTEMPHQAERSPRLDNMIAEQRRRLETAVIDTSGRSSPPRTNQSLSNLPEEASTSTANAHIDSRGRRGTAAELQGQLPWSYMPPSAHRMRDQLPPDEELPPVPVPDYTLHPKYRKACQTIEPDVLY